MATESKRVDALYRIFASAGVDANVTLGIGDDAAVLAASTEPLVWTVDAAVDGVHFRREWMTTYDIGWRSLMAAASDLAAMGATPRGVLSALVLPPDFSDADLESLAHGQAAAAAALGTSVVGGNLSRGGELSITTTALGQAARPVRRDGARVGDTVWLIGSCGWARAGLELLRISSVKPFDDASAPAKGALAAYRRPHALIAEGLSMAAWAHAAIDISDGLALDTSRVAHASGLRIIFDEKALVDARPRFAVHGVSAPGANAMSELSSLARELGIEMLDLLLYGGDDYALVVTGTGTAESARAIGICEQGSGIAIRCADGDIEELSPDGFDHFANGVGA